MIDLNKNYKFVNNNNLIYVKPINQYEFITYPIDNLAYAIPITLEQYIGLLNRTCRFTSKLSDVEYIYKEKSNENI